MVSHFLFIAAASALRNIHSHQHFHYSSYTRVARSITSACLRHRLFLSATSAYVISIFTTLRHLLLNQLTSYLFLRDYVVISNSIKRQHRTHFTHSSAGQRQRHYYLLASNNMDELQNLERIEQLCRNLRRQREQEQQHPLSATG